MGRKHFGAGILLLGTSIGSAHAADPVSRFLHLYRSEFKNPSDVAVLSKGVALVTQRTDGKVIFFDKGKKTTVLDLPVANGKGQGLLDISLSSIFKLNHHVELTFTGAAKDGGRSTGLEQQIYRWSPTAKKLTPVIVNIGEPTGASQGSSKVNTIPIDSNGSLDISNDGLIDQYASGTLNAGSPNLIGGDSGTMITANNGSVAGITLIDFSSIGAGTNDLITVNGDAVFRINNLNAITNFTANQPYPTTLTTTTAAGGSGGAVVSTFTGSFTLVDSLDDPNAPGYHLIDIPVVTFPTAGQLTVANTPEPASGALLLTGAGALIKRRQRRR